jgi:hypothetical protein
MNAAGNAPFRSYTYPCLIPVVVMKTKLKALLVIEIVV